MSATKYITEERRRALARLRRKCRVLVANVQLVTAEINVLISEALEEVDADAGVFIDEATGALLAPPAAPLHFYSGAPPGYDMMRPHAGYASIEEIGESDPLQSGEGPLSSEELRAMGIQPGDP